MRVAARAVVTMTTITLTRQTNAKFETMSDTSSIYSEYSLAQNEEVAASNVSDILPTVSTPINSPPSKRICVDTSLPSPVNSLSSTSLCCSDEDPDALFLSLIDEQNDSSECIDPDAIFLSDSEHSVADATTPRDHLLIKIAPLLIPTAAKTNVSATCLPSTSLLQGPTFLTWMEPSSESG